MTEEHDARSSSRSPTDPTGQLAVVAHSLIGEITATRGAIELAMDNPLGQSTGTLLALAIRRLDEMTRLVRNLAAGLPPPELVWLEEVGGPALAELDLGESTD